MLLAETGCGKTISYLLPIIDHLIKNPPNNSLEMNTPQVLIIVPTRELAIQIESIASALASSANLTVKAIIGGHLKKSMLDPEFSKIDILVGTPGAIGKLSTVGIYKLHNVQYTVLDECDTLFDDSFQDRLEGIINKLRNTKYILVSATEPTKLLPSLEHIQDSITQLKSMNLHKPLRNIKEVFLRLSKSSKPSQLLLICKQLKEPLLIFSNRNETCNWIAMFLRENGLKCSNINGDMNSFIRIQQWDDFINGKTNILSTTDIGSRGLDFKHVHQVLNYDFPFHAADYLHRVGRIGRLGDNSPSKSTNFISGFHEISLVHRIEVSGTNNIIQI